MNFPRLAVALCLMVPACAALAAGPAATHTEAAFTPPFTVGDFAGEEFDSLPLSHAGRIASAGVAASLPDVPNATLPAMQLPFYLMNRGAIALPNAPKAAAVRLTEPTFGASEVSLIDASPLAGLARKIGAQRFNTDDGSMLYDFAICYRVSRRSSVEVIPGDPAPVKLPVVNLQNNMGVTVGMVVRLGRQF